MGLCLETAIYILNKVRSKSIDVTPYEIWTNKKPYFPHIKVWVCEAKSDKCLFVGYPKETMGDQFHNSLEQKGFVLKHVIFLEK